MFKKLLFITLALALCIPPLAIAAGLTAPPTHNVVSYGLGSVPGVDATGNASVKDVVGNKGDAAAAGAVSTTESLVAYGKQNVTAGITEAAATVVIDAYHDVGTADAVTNAVMSDVTGNKADAAAAGAVSATESLMAYAKQNVTANIATTATLAGVPQTIAKTDGAVLTGNDALFVITGGPVRCKIVGLVTTVIGGASNGDIQITTTTPAATLDLNTAPVAISTDAAGTFYYNIGATSVFTPSATLGGVILDPVTVEEAEFILDVGTVIFRSSAAQTGVIAWYMTYTPLSPLSVVTAAP